MGVCTSSGKGNITSGKVKFSDINKRGSVFKRSEYENMVSKFVGGATNPADIKSAKDVAGYINSEMLKNIVEEPFVYDKETGRAKFTGEVKVRANGMKPSDLFDAKYNKDVGGYVLNRGMSTYYVGITDAKDDLERAGYSIRSVTKNGVTYNNVITKKRKTANGRTRYDIMK